MGIKPAIQIRVSKIHTTVKLSAKNNETPKFLVFIDFHTRMVSIQRMHKVHNYNITRTHHSSDLSTTVDLYNYYIYKYANIGTSDFL